MRLMRAIRKPSILLTAGVRTLVRLGVARASDLQSCCGRLPAAGKRAPSASASPPGPPTPPPPPPRPPFPPLPPLPPLLPLLPLPPRPRRRPEAAAAPRAGPRWSWPRGWRPAARRPRPPAPRSRRPGGRPGPGGAAAGPEARGEGRRRRPRGGAAPSLQVGGGHRRKGGLCTLPSLWLLLRDTCGETSGQGSTPEMVGRGGGAAAAEARQRHKSGTFCPCSHFVCDCFQESPVGKWIARGGS